MLTLGGRWYYPIWWTREQKLRYKEVKQLAPGHTARKWGSSDLASRSKGCGFNHKLPWAVHPQLKISWKFYLKNSLDYFIQFCNVFTFALRQKFIPKILAPFFSVLLPLQLNLRVKLMLQEETPRIWGGAQFEKHWPRAANLPPHKIKIPLLYHQN